MLGGLRSVCQYTCTVSCVFLGGRAIMSSAVRPSIGAVAELRKAHSVWAAQGAGPSVLQSMADSWEARLRSLVMDGDEILQAAQARWGQLLDIGTSQFLTHSTSEFVSACIDR